VLEAKDFHKRLDLLPLGGFLLARISCHFVWLVVNLSQEADYKG
jgi:hypothetical protein